MKFTKYLLDKYIQILIFIICFSIIILLLIAFHISKPLIILIFSILLFMGILLILNDYIRRKKFYNNLLSIAEQLDKKYLVLEMLEEPNFYEGKIFYQLLYDINKSMMENIKEYNISINDFKEYIEMWIHEVKIPISSLILLNHNHKNSFDKKEEEQIRKLDHYIDQVLYYVRSENAEKDYLIKETDLMQIINHIALKNKDDLLENKIDLCVEGENTTVLTDSKWLEFILNQIINNSIKYKKENDSYIKITIKNEEKTVSLSIYDNGVGIPKQDLDQVFNKSFTGENGRNLAKSTGMGLYIVKNLCEKLGHKIEIQSEYLEYTIVTITFSKNNFYKMQ